MYVILRLDLLSRRHWILIILCLITNKNTEDLQLVIAPIKMTRLAPSLFPSTQPKAFSFVGISLDPLPLQYVSKMSYTTLNSLSLPLHMFVSSACWINMTRVSPLGVSIPLRLLFLIRFARPSAHIAKCETRATLSDFSFDLKRCTSKIV